MNILLVHNFYQQPGGEDQVFAEEARLLEQHGHTVAHFTMDNDSVDGMGKIALAKKTIWNSHAQELIRTEIRRIDADVVHFHNTFPLISPAAYYAAHEAGAAVIQTLHNYRLMCPTATFYRDGHVCEDCFGRSLPWPGVLHKCYRQNLGASAAVATMLWVHKIRGTWTHAVDRYIVLTDFARQKFIDAGLPPDKIRTKPNFVDPDPGIGPGDGGFGLFVGRLTEEKGIRTLIEAWKLVHQTRGAILRIAGDGPLREVAEQGTRACPGIEYLGRRPPAEIYEMMGRAAALIFPSQWYEGLPKTIVESLAKGTPVIASRLGSMTELVEHGRTGLLFEPGNAPDLARQVDAMLGASPTDRSLMRQAARGVFEQHYTAQENYPMLLAIYDEARACMKHLPAAKDAAKAV